MVWTSAHTLLHTRTHTLTHTHTHPCGHTHTHAYTHHTAYEMYYHLHDTTAYTSYSPCLSPSLDAFCLSVHNLSLSHTHTHTHTHTLILFSLPNSFFPSCFIFFSPPASIWFLFCFDQKQKWQKIEKLFRKLSRELFGLGQNLSKNHSDAATRVRILPLSISVYQGR